jgi:hypothetical protein
MWIDGKPDFRVIDPDRVEECVNQKLCAICGHRLSEFCWFIGGEACKEKHLFLDAPMHEECAKFASRTCPFVRGDREQYSTRPVDPDKTRTIEIMLKTRPKMFLFKTRTKQVQVERTEEGIIFLAQFWQKVIPIAEKGDG